ncbi:SNF2-related protein, partial [Ottowia sp.]|uniref:SNF2-related protein n=1 Tax=Ottowia sp. TaxID=1898956 RepID=UPI0039E5C5E5
MGFLSHPDELRGRVGAATLERGRALARGGQVRECIVNEDEEDDGKRVLRIWVLEGRVQGSQRQPYGVDVRLEFSEGGALVNFLGECTCPVGFDCKHAVALALHAGAQHARWEGAPPAPAQARGEPPPMQCVEQWLRQIDSLHMQPPPAPDAHQDQTVYLLRAVAEGASPLRGLELSWQMARPLKRGGWSRPHTPPYGAEQRLGPQSPDAQAVRLVRALQDMRYGYASATWHPVQGSVGLLALQACAATGRLYLADAQGGITGEPLAWGGERAIDWAWQPAPAAAGQEPLWQLAPSLQGGPADLFACPPGVLYADQAAHACGSVHAPQVEAAHLPLMLAAPPLPASAFAAPSARLLRQLAPLPWPPGVQAPERWPPCAPVPHLVLALFPPGERAAQGLVAAALRFGYGGLRGWWPGRDAVVLADSPHGNAVLLTRDLAQEDAAIARLHALGLADRGLGRFGHASPTAWLDWAAQDWAPLREAGFVLDLAPGVDDLVQTIEELHVGMAEEGQGDGAGSAWFDLSLGIDVGGQRIDVRPWLPGWLAQVRHTPEGPALPEWLWQEQPDGRWLRLPSAPLQPWLRALLELVGERDIGDGRLSRLEALRLAASLGEGAVWDGAAHLRAMVAQLTGAGALPDVPVPAGLHAELRPYQRHGLAWLQFLRAHHLGGVLADDMGLGKTLQTLAHLLREQEDGHLDRPSLVIAPVSLLGNWRSEAARFAPSLRTRVWHGAGRHDTGFAEDCDLLVAPYSLLQRDRERWLGQRWHAVVLDEAQHIKNASTHAAQVVAGLDARQRIALTGTPLENHLGELWSLFHFLMPGFLGGHKRFGELFRTPIEKLGDTGALARLRQRVTPFM